uniref:Uncharacterized protein n=1 Tax=Zea mays TaxID=4577 RepID=C4J1S3_MAIZE|nr:unknown [Zea mays]
MAASLASVPVLAKKAASLASVPVLAKKARSANDTSTSRLASSTWGLV